MPIGVGGGPYETVRVQPPCESEHLVLLHRRLIENRTAESGAGMDASPTPLTQDQAPWSPAKRATAWLTPRSHPADDIARAYGSHLTTVRNTH